MPCQIQKNHTNPENHTNPSRTHKSTNPKKSYKPRNQTHKNHKRILNKKKINPYIYTNQIIQKKKIDLNLKIKSIQSLTKSLRPSSAHNLENQLPKSAFTP